MKKYKKNFKIFFYGFHYGFKSFDARDDMTFYTWGKDEKDNKLYRRAINIGKFYGTYRLEFFALFLVLLGMVILLFPY